MGYFWIHFFEMTNPLTQHTCMSHAKCQEKFELNFVYAVKTYCIKTTISGLPSFEICYDDEGLFFLTRFSEPISGFLNSCMSLDIWIEVTIYLYSKLKG